MKPVGIVTGMLSEAECISVAETPHTIFCAAGSPGRAKFGALKLLEEGARKLISFGIAGALDPARSPGDIVLASHVEDHAGHRFPTDTAWRQKIASSYRNIGAVTEGAIVTTDNAVATMRDKTTLFHRTKAVAVDMESAGVAEAALENGIPFLAIRVIADTSTFTLPHCALVGLDEDGSTRPVTVLAHLAARPWEFVTLLKLAGASKIATSCLSRIASVGF